MSRYDALSQRTLAAIKKAGSTVTFPAAITGTPATYDEETDTFSGGTSGSDVVGRAVQVKGDPDRWSQLGLTLTNPVTLKIAAQGLGVTPAPGMPFEWAGTSYVIRDAEAIAPDGEAILWTVVGDA